MNFELNRNANEKKNTTLIFYMNHVGVMAFVMQHIDVKYCEYFLIKFLVTSRFIIPNYSLRLDDLNCLDYINV